jgi:hypothetical protein
MRSRGHLAIRGCAILDIVAPCAPQILAALRRANRVHDLRSLKTDLVAHKHSLNVTSEEREPRIYYAGQRDRGMTDRERREHRSRTLHFHM